MFLNRMSLTYRVFGGLFLFFLSYYLFQAANYLMLALIGCFEELKRARQDEAEIYAPLAVSSFMVSISVILPAHNEELWIIDSVLSILNQRYAEFELIVVDDGSTDRTVQLLTERFELKHVNNPYTDHFKSGKIKGLYKSAKYPNITLLSKESGAKKAGAVNAGLNIAKHKYICTMDADTVLEEDALLKVMAQVQKDPEHIIGVGSYFGLVNGFKIKDGKIINRRFSRNPIVAYQNLEYIRTFIGNRIAWSRWNAMPNVAGGFGIWRRDALVELGGYDPYFSSEDMDLTFRAHDYVSRNRDKSYRILMLPYCIGWTEGPGDARALSLQRGRWHRVVLETIWRYRYMLFNPKYGRFAFITLPYFVFYEALGVYVEIICIALTAWGFMMAFVNARQFFGVLVFMILFQSFISLLPLLTFTRDRKTFRFRDIAYLSALSFGEFFWYRWVNTFAKLKGTYDFVRGVRVYDMVARNRV